MTNRLGIFTALIFSTLCFGQENYSKHQAAFDYLHQKADDIGEEYCHTGLIESQKFFKANVIGSVLDLTWTYQLSIQRPSRDKSTLPAEIGLRGTWPTTVGAIYSEDFGKRWILKIKCEGKNLLSIENNFPGNAITFEEVIEQPISACGDRKGMITPEPLKQLQHDQLNTHSFTYEQGVYHIGQKELTLHVGNFRLDGKNVYGSLVEESFKVENLDNTEFQLSKPASIEHGFYIKDSGFGECSLDNFCVYSNGSALKKIKPCQTPGSRLLIRYYSF